MALVVGVAGVALGHVGLLLWAGAIGAMATAALAWSRAAWRGVTVTARFHPLRVFAGQPLFLTVQLTNAKRLPIPIARLSVWLPAGLQPDDNDDQTTIRGFHRRVFVGGRSEVTFELPVRTRRRGEYYLERVVVELADAFDLAPVTREFTPESVVMVLPEPTISIPLDVRKRLPFGAPAAASRIFEQRERFGGVRPYEPGDPLNRIHWKLTGHTGKLQTKIFEPTRSAEVLFVLDLAAGEPFWDAVYPKVAEQTIGWASFLGRLAVESGWRIGLVTNGHFRRGRGPIRIPVSDAGGQEAIVFAALARMPNEPTSDLAPVLREAGRRLGRESVALILSPRPGPALRHEMAMLRRRGVAVVQASPLEIPARVGMA